MADIRQEREALEQVLIGEYGVKAVDTHGRQRPEPPCPVRTCFQRDVDRIIHSKPFRRLKHKTQVFLNPEGDHYRTRLTHTLEVSRIARTISRALCLNEDLTEAIALGHDLGHTPFGHAGERVLNELYPGGFRHDEQSLRVVDHLAKDGQGLNLCYETRMGILHHKNGQPDDTLEAKVVQRADRVAYINHDADDAFRAGILTADMLPASVKRELGDRNSVRIDTITRDIIRESSGKDDIVMSPAIESAVNEFRDFMFEKVYRNPVAKGEESKVLGILSGIYEYYRTHPSMLPRDDRALMEEDSLERAVCDYVSGMTDQYAIDRYSDLFLPGSWQVR